MISCWRRFLLDKCLTDISGLGNLVMTVDDSLSLKELNSRSWCVAENVAIVTCSDFRVNFINIPVSKYFRRGFPSL